MLIIIPCFNEEDRLNADNFTLFLKQHTHVNILFVDDHSSDRTLEKIKHMQQSAVDRIRVIPLPANVGKAEAVRQGFQKALDDKEHEIIAFLDADLATSLEECTAIGSLINEDCFLAFGSRIKKIDTFISRKKFRHYSGRILATIISNIIKLPIYDTQCGCKVFRRDAAHIAFKNPFISRWLFDLEIFLRLKSYYTKEKLCQSAKEIPLKQWIDIDYSKVKLSYFFKMWIDLYKIKRTYNA